MPTTLPGERVEVDREVEHSFTRANTLEKLGSDPTALKAVKFDRTETRTNEDGSVETVGFDDTAAAEVVVDRAEPTEPERGVISSVVEDGVSYDVETFADGRVFSLGRTGEPRTGISIQISGPRREIEDGEGEGPPEAAPGLPSETTDDLTPQQRMRETVRGAGEGLKEDGDPSKALIGVLEGTVDLVRDLPDATARGLVSAGAEAMHAAGILDDDEIKAFRDIQKQARKAFDVPKGAEITELGGSFMLPGGAIFAALRAAKIPTMASLVLSEGITAAVTQDPKTADVISAFAERPPEDPMWAELHDILTADPNEPAWEQRASVFLQNAGLTGAVASLLPAMRIAAKAGRAAPESFMRLMRDTSGEVKLVGPMRRGPQGEVGEWEVFDPRTGQVKHVVKSEDEARRLVEADRTLDYDIVEEAVGPPPVYVSQSADAINGAKMEKGTGEQWLAALKKGGAKDEELTWMGLAEMKDGKLVPAGPLMGKGITREDVLTHMDANAVQVREVVKGLGGPGGTKWHNYQLPGGENYRELLLTLPRATRDQVRPTETAAAPFLDEWNRLSREIDGLRRTENEAIAAGRDPGGARAQAEALEQRRDALHAQMVDATVAERGRNVGEPFTSSHFDEPNVLVHVRFNERTDVDGKRVLFIEEIQSDWHQQGRKRGYGTLEKRFEAGYFGGENRDQWVPIAHADNFDEAQRQGREWFSQAGVREGDNGINLRVQELPSYKRQGVPDAPFKKSWPDLALKRMLRWAADNDFDAVAWTPGKVQVDRYENALRNAVDEIHWEKTDKGIHLVGYKGGGQAREPFTAELLTGGGRRFEIRDADGLFVTNVIDPTIGPGDAIRIAMQRVRDDPDIVGGPRIKVVDTTEREDALSDAIGKAMAKDIVESPEQSGVIRGDNIRMDDTGMAGFYDRMLVRTADRLGKKYGVKTGEQHIAAGRRLDQMSPEDQRFIEEVAAESDRTPAELMGMIHEGIGHDDIGVPVADFNRAVSVMNKTDSRHPDTTVHTLPLTEKFKTAIKSGLPLFSAAPVGLALNEENDPSVPRILLAANDNGQLAQLGPFLRRGAEALRGRVGREAARNPPAPRTAQGQDEIVDLYSAYRTDTPNLEGIDFNLDNLETGTSVKELIDTVSRAYAPQITARTGGVIPHETTRQVADLIGMDAETTAKIIAGLPSDTSDLHVRALVMRDTLVRSAESVDRMANRIANLPDQITDTDLLNFRRAIERHALLQRNMKGVQTDIARALSAFRIPADAAPLARAQIVQEALQAGGGKATTRELAKLWVQTPVEKRARLASEGVLAKTVGALREIWINGLLSGLRTHEVNFAGNHLFTLWQIPERALAGSIGGVRKLAGAGPDRVYMGEPIDLMLGWVEGVPDALRLGWQTLKTGEPASNLAKIEASQYRAISSAKFGLDEVSMLGRFVDLVGTGVRLPGRALMSADEFQKGLARNMERRALARRFANMELERGKTVEEAAETYADVMLGGNETAESMVNEFADTVTYTKQLGEAGQSIQQFARRVPGMWVVAPFIRTPVNIVKEAAKRTPAVTLSPKFWKDVLSGTAEGDLALAKVSLGTGLMAWAAHLSAQGIIVGGGPSDPRMRRIWLQKHAPYSINMKKLLGEEQFKAMGLEREWWPYGRLEPLALLFGIGADLAEYRQWAPRDIAEEGEELMTARAVASVVESVSNKTFMQGLASFAAAYHDPERYAQRFVANFTGSMMPFSSFVRDIESAIDPERSETRINPYERNPFAAQFQATLNEWKARTPGFNSDLPNRTNFWNEPVLAYEGEWYQAFNAFAPRKDKSQPIDNELIRLRYPMAMPSRTAEGVKLNPHQYAKLIEAMNEISVPDPTNSSKTIKMRQYFNWLVNSPIYVAQINDEKKIALLQSKRNDFLDMARRALVTPGSKYFDSELFGMQIRAKTQKPLGIPFRP